MDAIEEAVIVTAQSRYDKLKEDREPYLRRARACAKVTIPTLVPLEGHTKHTVYPTPQQGVGARGVNTLASKLLLSLFPPNTPFFTMKVDDFTAQELSQDGQRAKVDEGLGKYERAVMQAIEDSGDRSAHFEALKQKIVAGNVLIQLPKDGSIRIFTLSRYVVSRDPEGNILECVIEEEIHYTALPDDVKTLVDANKEQGVVARSDDVYKVYTHYQYRASDKRLHGYQEVEGHRIEGSEGSWPRDKAPIIALRWTRIDGEDYGRSYVEEYLGDLISLEGLSKSINAAAAASARVVYLVNPNGVTRVKDVAKAENGDAVAGLRSDIDTLQTDKHADLSVAERQANTIIDRLSYAFLMNSAVQRSGERVTAEEVRFMAGELEDTLGGVYSILSQEYQLPYVKRVIDRQTAKKQLPTLPKGVAKPQIVTGLEALGRGHDLNKYDMFLKALTPLGPDAISQYMNVDDYITRIGTSLGIDLTGLIKTRDQIAQEKEQDQEAMQQQQLTEMAGKAAPALVKEGAAMMREAQ